MILDARKGLTRWEWGGLLLCGVAVVAGGVLWAWAALASLDTPSRTIPRDMVEEWPVTIRTIDGTTTVVMPEDLDRTR